ncbi:MAG: pyridoxamine 5'-phosphate oxidase family protein [Sphingomonadaceae bacterium]|nr:pyridoxamine 5'-phosphate oxidase family protein [Sphingomonadaceae bacterium]
MTRIATLEALEALYTATPSAAATLKEVAALTPGYRALIAASPFCILATSGPGGLDASPRGDAPGFVRVLDDRTLALPDRRGNNRIDSLRNIVADSRVALLFLIPGSGTTFRVTGTAAISVDPDLLASFAAAGRPPRSVLIVTVTSAYFQCPRCIVQSGLWGPPAIDPRTLPTGGALLAEASAGRVNGAAYDAANPEAAAGTPW